MQSPQSTILRVVAYLFLALFVLIVSWLSLPSPLLLGDVNSFGIFKTTPFTRVYRTQDFPVGDDFDYFALRYEVSPEERLLRISQDSLPAIAIPLKSTSDYASKFAVQLNVSDWLGYQAQVRIADHEGIVPSWVPTGDAALLSWQLAKRTRPVDMQVHYIEDQQKLASFQLTTPGQTAPLISVHWNDNCHRPVFAVQFPSKPSTFPPSATYRIRSLILSILWPVNLVLSYAFMYTLMFLEITFGSYAMHISIVLWSLVLVGFPVLVICGRRRNARSFLPKARRRAHDLALKIQIEGFNTHDEKRSLIDTECRSEA